MPPVMVTPAMIALEPAGASNTRPLFRASITVVRAPAPEAADEPGAEDEHAVLEDERARA